MYDNMEGKGIRFCIEFMCTRLLILSFSHCQVVGQFYLDTASMVWNGHSVAGQDSIVKFLTNLPGSEHKILSLDAQPIASKCSFTACNGIQYQ